MPTPGLKESGIPEYVAKLIGRDPKTDVALLKIDVKKKLPSVVLGNSEKLRVGEIVVAIGNPFGGDTGYPERSGE